MPTKTQTSCLVATPSPEYMNFFDGRSAHERTLIRNARYDLCIACIEEYLDKYEISLEYLIEVMERAIRSGADNEYVHDTLQPYRRVWSKS